MAWFQKPGAKVGKLEPNRSKFFRQGDLISILGATPVFLNLPSDDVLIVRNDYENQSLGVSEFATDLLHKPVYGPALVAEMRELEP